MIQRSIKKKNGEDSNVDMSRKIVHRPPAGRQVGPSLHLHRG